MKIKLIKTILLLLLSGLFMIVPVLAFAQTTSVPANCKNFYDQFQVNSQPTVNGKPQTVGNIIEPLPKICDATSAILTIINFGMAAAGIVAVLFLMFGGYSYLTSAGNDEQAEFAHTRPPGPTM